MIIRQTNQSKKKDWFSESGLIPYPNLLHHHTHNDNWNTQIWPNQCQITVLSSTTFCHKAPHSPPGLIHEWRHVPAKRPLDLFPPLNRGRGRNGASCCPGQQQMPLFPNSHLSERINRIEYWEWGGREGVRLPPSGRGNHCRHHRIRPLFPISCFVIGRERILTRHPLFFQIVWENHISCTLFHIDNKLGDKWVTPHPPSFHWPIKVSESD